MNLRWRFLEHWQDAGLLILRTGVGAVLLGVHGYPLLSEGSSGWIRTGRAVSLLGLSAAYLWWGMAAMLAMTVGGACLIMGFFHRPAALVLTGAMGLATAWSFSQSGGIAAAAYPFTMMIVCVSLFILGPGKYSFDKP